MENYFYKRFRKLCIFWDQKFNLATFVAEGSASAPGNTSYVLTHSCPPFQHLLSERLTSLGMMGEPRVGTVGKNVAPTGPTAYVGTLGKNGLIGIHTGMPTAQTTTNAPAPPLGAYPTAVRENGGPLKPLGHHTALWCGGA